jgi:hypothetical protein
MASALMSLNFLRSNEHKLMPNQNLLARLAENLNKLKFEKITEGRHTKKHNEERRTKFYVPLYKGSCFMKYQWAYHY